MDSIKTRLVFNLQNANVSIAQVINRPMDVFVGLNPTVFHASLIQSNLLRISRERNFDRNLFDVEHVLTRVLQLLFGFRFEVRIYLII